MARIKLSDELKKEIASLSFREKDKLLYRLIAKDDKLVEQLQFRLIELEETTEERRGDCSDQIRFKIEELKKYSHFSAARLLFNLRRLSGRITRHVQVTKDKYGEVSLNLEMLLLSLEEFGGKFPKKPSRKLNTLSTYMIKRTQKILKLIQKLHEDYQMDFMDDLRQLGTYLSSIDTLKAKGVELSLDLQGLENGEPF